MIPLEKEVDATFDERTRLTVKILCPTCTACRHFDILTKTNIFGDVEEILWCRQKEACTDLTPCKDFE